MNLRTPPLAETLAMLLPAGRDKMLLRACLAERTVALSAWNDWLAATPEIGGFEGSEPGVRRLLPLLHAALVAHGAVIDAPTLALLRAASLAESLRTARIRELLQALHARLLEVGVASELFNGIALAQTVYPRAELRHCHDIDLLIPPDDLRRACEAALVAGFTPIAEAETGSPVTLRHRDGLPLHLHTELPWPNPARPSNGRQSQPVTRTVGGEIIAALHPADSLVHLAGYAMNAVDTDFRIVLADVTAILRSWSASGGEWERMLERARDGGQSLPVFVILTYLNREIGIPIEATALSGLAEDARKTTSAQKDFLLSVTRGRPGGYIWTLFRRSGWRSRLEIARWMLLPSRCFLRWWCAQHRIAWSRYWYAGRPLRGAGRLLGASSG